MTPTPDALIGAVRALLRPIGVELSSTESKAAFRRALYVLREGRWSDAAFDLLRENDEIGDAGNRARAFLGEPAQAGNVARPASYAEADARNRALREELAALLDRLDGPELAESRALRRDLAILLRGPR